MVAMTETGVSPLLSADELREIGFKFVVWPSAALRIAVHQISIFFAELRSTGDSRSWLNRMASLKETNSLLGLERVLSFENCVAEK